MGFSMPQLSSSCCGCTLRTGSLIILWIYLVGSILIIVVPPLVPTNSATNSTTPVNPASTTAAPLSDLALKPLDVWGVIVSVINVVVGIVGLYGVYKDLHLYLIPFLVWEAFYTLQQVLRELIASFTISTILGELIGLLILFYFWLVVYSHYRVLKGSARPIQA